MKQGRKASLNVTRVPLRRWAASACTSALVAAALSGCSVAPVYHKPEVAIADNVWQDNLWGRARPADDIPRGSWWELFHDATLSSLETKVDNDNPSLTAALARYQQSLDYTSQLQAGLGPTVDGSASFTDNRQSKNRPLRGSGQPNIYDANTVGLSANYTLDIWGQIHSMVASGKALSEASAADLETAKLSLEAQVAQNYMALRGVDAQIAIVKDAIHAYTDALDLTERRHDGGVSSGIDVSRAQTQLSTVKSQLSDLHAERAVYEHAIAVLTGQEPMGFSIAPQNQSAALPDIPVSLPSELLERRPDIASAERKVASANANIGVAKAAYYPNISLSAFYGVQNTGQADFFSIPNTLWSIGPGAVLNLFDYGKHDAQLAQAKAVFDESSANYKSVVLTAFQQVADNLSKLKFDKQSEIDQQDAVKSSNVALELALNRYREGVVNYLDVVYAQEAALTASQRAEQIHAQQLTASVDLIRALGGGWKRSSNVIQPELQK